MWYTSSATFCNVSTSFWNWTEFRISLPGRPVLEIQLRQWCQLSSCNLCLQRNILLLRILQTFVQRVHLRWGNVQVKVNLNDPNEIIIYIKIFRTGSAHAYAIKHLHFWVTLVVSWGESCKMIVPLVPPWLGDEVTGPALPAWPIPDMNAATVSPAGK